MKPPNVLPEDEKAVITATAVAPRLTCAEDDMAAKSSPRLSSITVGTIREAEPITDEDDLKDAKQQNEAMNAAGISLSAATTQAVSANAGYRADAVIPVGATRKDQLRVHDGDHR
jgi:hypothetical protein